MHILDKIVQAKKTELVQHKLKGSIDDLMAAQTFQSTISFSSNIKQLFPGIISEFKRRSPSKSNINISADPSTIAKTYELNGAAAISVLTNETFFGGSNMHLSLVRSSSELPILRKEFIIDEYQIYEARSLGADAILLISEILSKEEILRFCKLAHSLNLEVLLELHDKSQISKINDLVNVIGINNRNLKTFKTDIQQSIDVYKDLPRDIVKISESGISNANAIRLLLDTGYEGFLIGEHFMTKPNPGEALKSLINDIQSS